MKLYGAIDLHSNNSMAVLINKKDHLVFRKRLKNNLDLILSQLAPYKSRIEGLVVESTYNWYWLVDGLKQAGYQVHLANTNASRQYDGLKYSDDEDDARWLAHLLRNGLLKEGYILKRNMLQQEQSFKRICQIVLSLSALKKLK